MKKQNTPLNTAPRKTHLDALEERFPLHEQNENAKLCTGKQYGERNPQKTVRFGTLASTPMDGFPMRIDRDEQGELTATFTDNTHSLIIGSTGSGKTTGFVLPFLYWQAAKKNKPSILVSDPKNELSRKTAKHFKDNGYRVIWLNFQDYSVSDCWNPLTKIYRHYQEYLNIENSVKVAMENGKLYNVFGGKVYKKQSQLDRAILAEQSRILAEVDNMIGSFAETIAPVQKMDDPYWDQISSTFLRGFLWAMLEDSAEDCDHRITEETYTMDTLIRIFDSFKDSNHCINDHGYFSSRDPINSKAYQLAYAGIINLSADSTRSCIISCFSEKIKIFRDTSIRYITRANTVEFDSLDEDEAPTVIFVSYKDEESLHYNVISLFVSDLYTSLIGKARQKKGTLERPFYFLLDEFGNFPRFKDFETVISACRSRNIWFELIVQSYAQLERVYGKDTADIIEDNLNMHLFFGSGNFETKKAFSLECGQKEIISATSAINGSGGNVDHFATELVPLIPISRLSMLDVGECIITQMRGDVIHSKIERSYLCPEYDVEETELEGRHPGIDLDDPAYRYSLEWLLKLPTKSSKAFF